MSVKLNTYLLEAQKANINPLKLMLMLLLISAYHFLKVK